MTLTTIIGTAILLALLIFSLSLGDGASLKPRIWQLNQTLKQDPKLAEYPYDFRALMFLHGVVTLTRPYDDQVPVVGFLAAQDPSLAGKPADDPAVVAAAERLRDLEMHAIGLMLAQPDVNSVLWALDRARLSKLGVALPAAR